MAWKAWLRGLVRGMGQIFVWVAWVTWAHKILAWVTWVTLVHKTFVWVKTGVGQRNGVNFNVFIFNNTL